MYTCKRTVYTHSLPERSAAVCCMRDNSFCCRDSEVLTVPLVDSIDALTFEYSSIYRPGSRPIGIWEWGLLYKVQYLLEPGSVESLTLKNL